MTEILTETTPPATETGDWKEGIAEEHLSAVSGFQSKAELAKGYSELFTKMGSYTKIPAPDSPEEEVNAFYKKAGRPDTPDGYTVPKLEENQEVNKEFFSRMAAGAHEAGMSSSQFDKLVANYVEYERQVKEAEVVEFNRHREEADRKLHETYGADYDKNIELSKRAYTEYASDELKKLLETDKWIGLRNEPAFINMMVEIAKKNMDDTFVKGEGQVEKPKDGYIPASPKSPEMYANAESEEGAKARAYFRARGYEYSRDD
jgi:hypothetical protein